MARADPRDAVTFVGRARELAQLEQLVEGERLVTVWGPGGIGKTRLARALAATLPEALTIELGACSDVDAFTRTMVKSLSLPPTPAEPLDDAVTRIGRALADRGRVVLLLDDLEQVAASAAPAIARWLVAAPQCRVVVTSRELLQLPDEHALELGPLASPAASELFGARVRARTPSFVIDAANAARVARLVEGLDGIPLAIELAAARYDVLGLDGLVSRLADASGGYGGRGVGRAPRQSTLRAAIMSSWELLDDELRWTFAALAVMSGDFTLAAAEAVLARPSTSTSIAALRAKSLLVARDGPNATRRLGMLPSIAELAHEQLAHWSPEERGALAARYATWMLTLAEDAAAEYRRSGSLARVDLLEAEAPHVHALVRAGGESAARAAAAWEIVGGTRGPYASYLALLDAALVSISHTEPYVDALRARGRIALLLGRVEDAERDLSDALARAHAAGFARIEADARADLGVLHHQARRLEDARALYDLALVHYRTAHERRAEGRVLGNLGAVAHDARRFDDAIERYDAALACLRTVGDERIGGIVLMNRALAASELGHPEEAFADSSRALDALERARDPRLVAIALGNLGALLQQAGRHDEASPLHERALTLLRQVGDPRSEALCLARLAGVRAAQHDASGARAYHDAARATAASLDPITRAIVVLAGAFVGEPAPDRSVADVSDDARALLRIVDVVSAKRTSNDAVPLFDIGLAPDGTWLRTPDGTVHQLQRRRALRLIVMALAACHAERRARGLTVDEVLAAGWPGERMAPESGLNRVYVAIATLRQLGLKDVIVKDGDGYRFAPATRVS